MTSSRHPEDLQLLAFAGVEAEVDEAAIDRTIDEHVATCDECQAFLAEVWSGGLDKDLAEPVVRYLRFEQFLMEVAKLAMDVAGGMGKAAGVYLGGAEEQPSSGAGRGEGKGGPEGPGSSAGAEDE